MKIVDIKNKNSVQNAAEVLKTGGVLIFPTDTVYGIGCVLNKDAVRKLYKIKNRPASQPTAVLMTKKQMSQLTRYSALINTFPAEFESGKMTVIIQADKFNINFPKMILSDAKIGIRLPQDAWLENLIDQVGPIVASSANKKGERPPTKFSEVSPQLIKEADLTIQTEETLSGQPSTVFDLTTNKVIRT